MSDLRKIVHNLERWFTENQRQLPWRSPYTPYKTWVSEIMLQQTRVDTVIDYFNRWMIAFPDIKTLATSKEDRVLKMWEGLGYYSRGRNLLQAAKLIVDEHQGKIPEDRKTLETLPGIGPYTAGAISSIAYGHKEPCIDGNIQRVFSRIWDWDVVVNIKPSHLFFHRQAEDLLQYANPRILNQALMELGARVCLPKGAKCAQCPIPAQCLSKNRGTVALRPVKKVPPPTLKQTIVYLVFHHENQFYLEKQQQETLWKGMWIFPSIQLEEKEEIINRILEYTGETSKQQSPEKLIDFTHSVTRYRIHGHAFLIQSDKTKMPLNRGEWFPLQKLDDLPLPKSGVIIRDRLRIKGDHVW